MQSYYKTSTVCFYAQTVCFYFCLCTVLCKLWRLLCLTHPDHFLNHLNRSSCTNNHAMAKVTQITFPLFWIQGFKTFLSHALQHCRATLYAIKFLNFSLPHRYYKNTSYRNITTDFIIFK